MEREILLRQLVQVEQGVAEGKAFMLRQAAAADDPWSRGRNLHRSCRALRLLEAFLVLQRSREEDRA